MNRQTDGYQFKIEGDARNLNAFLNAIEHIATEVKLDRLHPGLAYGDSNYGFGFEVKRVPQEELRLRKQEESSDIPLEVAEAVIDGTV